MRKIGKTITHYSEKQLSNELPMIDLAASFLADKNVPDDQKLRNIALFLKPQVIARILYFHDIYQKIVDIPGVVLEFGVQYGASLALLMNLRNCMEYFNISRRIVGFDTFCGFPSVCEHDKNNEVGDYGVSAVDRDRLASVMEFIDSLSPDPSVKKYELVEGTVFETLPVWLDANPQAIIALAHFDLDLFEPTEFVLEKINDRLTRGSVLVFDELNHPEFPGETLAVMRRLGLRNLALRRHPLQPFCAWAVVE
jgi:SAM-dependent methyltransferase